METEHTLGHKTFINCGHLPFGLLMALLEPHSESDVVSIGHTGRVVEERVAGNTWYEMQDVDGSGSFSYWATYDAVTGEIEVFETFDPNAPEPLRNADEQG